MNTTITDAMLQATEEVFTAQTKLDKALHYYALRLATVSLKALSAELYPGKREGEPMRAVSNDKERDLAIDWLTSHDKRLAILKAEVDAQRREVNVWNERGKNLRLIVRLSIACAGTAGASVEKGEE